MKTSDIGKKPFLNKFMRNRLNSYINSVAVTHETKKKMEQ